MELDKMELDGSPEMSRSPTPASPMYVESTVEDEEGARKAEGDTISVFDRVTAELIKLGAIPLERFAVEDNVTEGHRSSARCGAVGDVEGRRGCLRHSPFLLPIPSAILASA